MARQVEKANEEPKQVLIRTNTGMIARIPIDDVLKEQAIYWCKRLDNRSKLNDADRIAMRNDAIEKLAKFSIDDDGVRKMAEDGVVQVTIPFEVSDLNPRKTRVSSVESALMMPWEYVLSAATKKYRVNHALCVVRHVDGNNAATQLFQTCKSFCFVESAPGEFAKHFDFSTERELIEGAFGKQRLVTLPPNSTIDELASTLRTQSPEALHFRGVDSRQGALIRKAEEAKELAAKQAAKDASAGANSPQTVKDAAEAIVADNKKPEKKVKKTKITTSFNEEAISLKSEETNEFIDGLFFTKDKVAKDTNFRKIAKAATSGKDKPQLIGFNSQYSGARIAPFCIARGAREAIGVQNTLDDDLAERFFIRFYQHWLSSKQDSLAAFIAAWEFIKPMGTSIKGTGIILWFNTNIFARREGSKFIEPTIKGIEAVKNQLKSDRTNHTARSEVLAQPETHKVKDLVRVRVETTKVITPCMLQYGTSVLEKLEFTFLNLNPTDEMPVKCINEIDVEVTLSVGQDTFPYRTQVSLGLDHPKLQLANCQLTATEENPAGGIRVPLTSQLIQSADDNVRASLFVNIEWKGQSLLKHTYSVDIAPVNEWRLNEKDSLLQPMFLQPRNSAVKEILNAAQKYLRCLEGDAKSGFRGYQADDIEPQIEAIWSALLYDFKLDYISPPPSFNEGTQRLRTPSQVLTERRGTCVDLALLFASCLEWIELYPVVFNTSKHAFVGCWRYSETLDDSNPPTNDETGEEILSYEKFFKLHKRGAFAKKESIVDSYPWVLTPQDFGALSDLVYQDAIIPLETVCLTEYRLYNSARDYAVGYFTDDSGDNIVKAETLQPSKLDGFDPGTFESLTDVFSSRQFLQPLPLSRI